MSRRSPRITVTGAGIAVRELDAMGLLEALQAQAVAPTSLVYCSRHGREIWREARSLIDQPVT